MITLTRYEAGEVIVKENDLGETAYVIGQGRVEVTRELNGRNVHLAYLGVGDTFGEMSVIDEKPRSASVTAVTETVVSEIRRGDFFNIFQTDPNVALTLLRVLFERLREADAMILRLQKADPQQGADSEGTDAPSPSAGTAHGYAGRGNPTCCRRSPSNSISARKIPLSHWQKKPRPACL